MADPNAILEKAATAISCLSVLWNLFKKKK